MTTTTTIAAPLAAFAEAAAATLPHLSKDDVTPILTTARVTRDPERGVIVAGTDRYTVGEYVIPSDDTARHFESAEVADPSTDDPAILIPRDALEWIAKLTYKSLRRGGGRAGGDMSPAYAHTVIIEHATKDDHDPGTLTVTVRHTGTGSDERSQAFDGFIGNFPPVQRLLPALDAEPFPLFPNVGIDPAHLKRVMDYATKHHKGAPIVFAGTGDEATNGSHKRTPILATIGNLRALIQPVNVTR